jgi:hypothetical protein
LVIEPQHGLSARVFPCRAILLDRCTGSLSRIRPQRGGFRNRICLVESIGALTREQCAFCGRTLPWSRVERKPRGQNTVSVSSTELSNRSVQ